MGLTQAERGLCHSRPTRTAGGLTEGTGRNAEHRNAECGAEMPNPGMPNRRY